MIAASDFYFPVCPKRSELGEPSRRTPPRLYRQFFTAAECRMLDSSPPETALSEIYLLRMLLAQALAAAKARRRLSLMNRLSMLTVFSRTTLIMASLVRFQDKYFGFGSPGNDPLDALDDLDPYDLLASEESL